MQNSLFQRMAWSICIGIFMIQLFPQYWVAGQTKTVSTNMPCCCSCGCCTMKDGCCCCAMHKMMPSKNGKSKIIMLGCMGFQTKDMLLTGYNQLFLMQETKSLNSLVIHLKSNLQSFLSPESYIPNPQTPPPKI